MQYTSTIQYHVRVIDGYLYQATDDELKRGIVNYCKIPPCVRSMSTDEEIEKCFIAEMEKQINKKLKQLVDDFKNRHNELRGE